MIETKNIKLNRPFLLYDSIFKSVFNDNENILAKMISDITGLNYLFLENNIILENSELSVDRFNEKFKRCDFIVRVNDNNIINLEINTKTYPGYLIKNLSYVFHIFKTNSVKGDKYNENLVVTQININNFNTGDKALSKYYLKEEETNEIYSRSLEIFDLSVEKCKKIYYNNLRKEVPNYIKWGALLSCKVDETEEMEKILSELLMEKEVEVIMSKIDDVKNASLFMPEAERLAWEEWEYNSIMADAENKGMEKGMEKGIEKGMEKGIEETIKKMIENGIDINTISKVTNKSIEEIEKIGELGDK